MARVASNFLTVHILCLWMFAVSVLISLSHFGLGALGAAFSVLVLVGTELSYPRQVSIVRATSAWWWTITFLSFGQPSVFLLALSAALFGSGVYVRELS